MPTGKYVVHGKHFVQMVMTSFGGHTPGYWQDASGQWWLHNMQRGWVEVPANSKTLAQAIANAPHEVVELAVAVR